MLKRLQTVSLYPVYGRTPPDRQTMRQMRLFYLRLGRVSKDEGADIWQFLEDSLYHFIRIIHRTHLL